MTRCYPKVPNELRRRNVERFTLNSVMLYAAWNGTFVVELNFWHLCLTAFVSMTCDKMDVWLMTTFVGREK